MLRPRAWIVCFCLACCSCSQGPEVAIQDWDTPSATPTVAFPPPDVGLVETGTPVPESPLPAATPTATPNPPPIGTRVRVEARFGRAGARLGKGVRLSVSDREFPEKALPPMGSEEPALLPLSAPEVFVAAELPTLLQSSLCRALWYSPDPKDKPSSDTVTLEPGQKMVQFSLLRPARGWRTSGLYRVEVSCGETTLGTAEVTFEDRGDTAPLETTPPGKVVLSNDEEGKNAGDSFPVRGGPVCLHVDVRKLAKGTPVKVSWVAGDLPKIDPGQVLSEADEPAPGGDEALIFTYVPPTSLGAVPGRYRVELRVRGKLAYRQSFVLREGS